MEVTNKMNTVTLGHAKTAMNTILEWIYEIWFSDSIITNQMILNSFKYTGINSQLDGNEDHQFRGYEKKGTKL